MSMQIQNRPQTFAKPVKNNFHGGKEKHTPAFGTNLKVFPEDITRHQDLKFWTKSHIVDTLTEMLEKTKALLAKNGRDKEGSTLIIKNIRLEPTNGLGGAKLAGFDGTYHLSDDLAKIKPESRSIFSLEGSTDIKFDASGKNEKPFEQYIAETDEKLYAKAKKESDADKALLTQGKIRLKRNREPLLG